VALNLLAVLRSSDVGLIQIHIFPEDERKKHQQRLGRENTCKCDVIENNKNLIISGSEKRDEKK